MTTSLTTLIERGKELSKTATKRPWFCYKLEESSMQAWEIFSVPKSEFQTFQDGICSIWHHRKNDAEFITFACNHWDTLTAMLECYAELSNNLIESHEGTYGGDFWQSPMGKVAKEALERINTLAEGDER